MLLCYCTISFKQHVIPDWASIASNCLTSVRLPDTHPGPWLTCATQGAFFCSVSSSRTAYLPGLHVLTHILGNQKTQGCDKMRPKNGRNHKKSLNCSIPFDFIIWTLYGLFMHSFTLQCTFFKKHATRKPMTFTSACRQVSLGIWPFLQKYQLETIGQLPPTTLLWSAQFSVDHAGQFAIQTSHQLWRGPEVMVYRSILVCQDTLWSPGHERWILRWSQHPNPSFCTSSMIHLGQSKQQYIGIHNSKTNCYTSTPNKCNLSTNILHHSGAPVFGQATGFLKLHVVEFISKPASFGIEHTNLYETIFCRAPATFKVAARSP